MGQSKIALDTSQEEKSHRLMEVVYARKTRENQIYLEDLKDYRKRKEKRVLRTMVKSIGPKWYQALSVPQRKALDTLDMAIHQDSLEGRPIRSQRIMKVLGIIPRPSNTELMECVNLGINDPKEMLAALFHFRYGHYIDSKRSAYDLNSRLLASAVLYLGLDNLIYLLRERFRPDPEEEKKEPKPKRKIEQTLASPYLQAMVTHMYKPRVSKRCQPLPLPSNLDELNEPYEDPPPMAKPPPPPPPPPPPKKRLPRAYCDKIAGVMTIEPYRSVPDVSRKSLTRASLRNIKGLKKDVTEEKKVYGMGSTLRGRQSGRRKKPVAPTTGLASAQFMINGVFTVYGRTVYVLGNVSILPPDGDLIHGGFAVVQSEFINVHDGFRAYPPPPKPDDCDCLKKWTDTVIQYVKKTKCYCGHHYDYGNEGPFPQDEVPFFQPSTRNGPLQFNYNTIFEVDPKAIQIQKDFKKIWETDSMIRVEDSTQKAKPPKKKKRTSKTCLGEKPTPGDYLMCALRPMRSVNIAARLPDAHLVPELQEWMRRRLYGPYSDLEKAHMIHKSHSRWQVISRLSKRGVAHVPVPKEERFTNVTNWIHKQDLNNKFRNYIEQYRLDMFRAQAEFNNLLWPSMFQAELPDKKFREIFFSYMVGRVEDLQVMHPYVARETAERYAIICKKPYVCKPAGIESDY